MLAPMQVAPAHWDLQHGRKRKTVGCIICADRPFGSQIIQFLRVSIIQRAHKALKPVDESSIFFDQV